MIVEYLTARNFSVLMLRTYVVRTYIKAISQRRKVTKINSHHFSDFQQADLCLEEAEVEAATAAAAGYAAARAAGAVGVAAPGDL